MPLHDSRLPSRIPPSHGEDGRVCLRCLGCERHLGCTFAFVGQLALAGCRTCKYRTSFERVASDGPSFMRARGDTRRTEPRSPFRCAHCRRVLLRASAFSGTLEVLCARCKKLNRLTGEQHAASTDDRQIPLAWERPRPFGPRMEWTPDALIPLLEQRWEVWVRDRAKRRAEVAVGLRFDVFHRDGFRCRYCGISVDEGAILQADHVIPQSKGGPTTLANLVTACIECNLGKSAKDIGARPVLL